MQKQGEIEERILGLILGIGTIIGFFLRTSQRGRDAGDRAGRTTTQELG